MEKILVIDDDLDILSVLEILLSMKGYEVEVSAIGANTVHRVKSFSPNLVLLDVLISGHDGRTICKELKSEEDTRNIPVIMLSAHPGAAATIKEYGADDFIAKPFEVKRLLATIRKHLEIVKN